MDEFGDKWCLKLGTIVSVLDHIQADDEDSKLLFNNVKNATKNYQDKHKSADPSATRIKISNGFKSMVSKIIRQFLKSLQFKIDTYLSGKCNRVEHSDIKKIIRLSANLDSLDDLRAQFEEFDESVKTRVTEMESARQLSK